MVFSDIYGQKDVISRLQHSLTSGFINHCYAFCGPEGIGKRTMARIFARAVLCTANDPAGGCGSCLSCRSYDAGTNPDFLVVSPADGNIGVDSVRLLHESIIKKPVNSGKKVVLIENAGKMTMQAQNSMLKILEEPPSYCVMILTVSNYDALLPTVRSRLSRLDFRRNTDEEVIGFLAANCEGTEAEHAFAASYSDGLIGAAAGIASSPRYMELREGALESLLRIYDGSLSKALSALSFFENNKNDIGYILDFIESFIRDMLLTANGIDGMRLINSDKSGIITSVAAKAPCCKFVRDIDAIGSARASLRHNANFATVMDVLVMKLQEDCDIWLR